MTDEEPSAEMKELCLQAADSTYCSDCGEKLTEVDMFGKTVALCVPCMFKSETTLMREYPVYGVSTGRMSMRGADVVYEGCKKLAENYGVAVTVNQFQDSYLVQFEKP